MPDDDFEPYWIEGRPANDLAREMLNTAHKVSLSRMRELQPEKCPRCGFIKRSSAAASTGVLEACGQHEERTKNGMATD